MRKKTSDESTLKSSIAYAKIYDLILSGKKPPNTRLILNDLEKELGIGRGPIREELMRLDRSGLVQNLPYKGVVVAPLPSFREMEQIFLLRIELELFLAQEAMKKVQASTLNFGRTFAEDAQLFPTRFFPFGSPVSRHYL